MTLVETPAPQNSPVPGPVGEVEEWKKIAGGTTSLRLYRGGTEVRLRIGKGAVFHLTPEERRQAQASVRNKVNDNFTNGRFKLLRPVEGVTDSLLLETNADVLEDAHIEELVEASLDTLTAAVNEINSPVTVARIYQAARRAEVGKRKMAAITARMKQLDPKQSVIGDHLAAGREDPDDQRKGPAATVDVESEPAPRTYAGLES